MTLVSGWNPSNTLGGPQQHTLNSGNQEMPSGMLGDENRVGQSLFNSMAGKDIFSKESDTLVTILS